MSNQEKNTIKELQKAPVIGVSEQLKQEFQLLHETRLSNGMTKYSNTTVDTLAANLVCRKYANLCFEFTHYAWMILHSKGLTRATKQQLLLFFWCDHGHHKTGCQAYFERSLRLYSNRVNDSQELNLSESSMDKVQENRLITVTSNMRLNVEIELVSMQINQYSFSIHYSRANLLACFIEWLILVIPNLLSLLTERLLGNGASSIRETANYLQKQIYGYLGKHLNPVKLQKRYQAMASFYGTQSLDCELILSFWRYSKMHEGCSKYSSVVDDSLAYHYALKTDELYQSQHRAESLEHMLHSNISEQDTIYETLLVKQSEINIDALEKTPKVLNRRQLDMVDFMIENHDLSVQLPTTYLRLKTFGSAQAKIIQALREHKLTDLDDYIDQGYQHSVDYLIAIRNSNIQALMAIFAITSKIQLRQACVLLIDICKHSRKYSEHINELKNLLSEFFKQSSNFKQKKLLDSKHNIELSKDFAQACGEWRLKFDWFNELMREISDAHKSINRSGFTDKTLLKANDYQVSLDNILKLNTLIVKMLKQIQEQQLARLEKFQADRCIFISEFNQMYLQDENKHE